MWLAHTFSVSEGSRIVRLIDRPDHISYAELARDLRERHLAQIISTNILVVRPPVYEPLDESVFDKRHASELCKLAGNAAVHWLYSHNYQIRLSRNLNPAAYDEIQSDDDKQRLIDELQQQEMRSFVAKSNAIFPKREKFVYRAPSETEKVCAMARIKGV